MSEFDDAPRVYKREMIARVAKRSGYTQKITREVYEALLEELTHAVDQGETVVLMDFGRFRRQIHKGHKVRFGPSTIDDYSVLKFSASRNMNRKLTPVAVETLQERTSNLV